jgi:anti-sigma factor RsiW
MIHCDEVFDILTRGPFPTGAPSDGIVEAHLGQCEACRQLAEALRPAIELLQEAISPEESGDLPRYRGAAAEPRSAWSQSDKPGLKTKPKLAVRRPHRAAAALEPAMWPWRSAAKFVAAACVGLVLAGLLRQVVASGGALHRGQTQAVAVAAHWRLEQDGRQWTVENHLSDDCLEPVAERTIPVSTAGDGLKLACCLGCHSAAKNSLVRAAQIGSFVQTCTACH